MAISVVDPETFAPLASLLTGKQVSPRDVAALEDACRDKMVVKTVLDEYTKIARQRGLAGYEFIKNVHLRVEPFTVENGLITPTFKMKRPEAKKLLAKELEELYALPPTDTSARL